jgi:hypothetical protein
MRAIVSLRGGNGTRDDGKGIKWAFGSLYNPCTFFLRRYTHDSYNLKINVSQA